MKIFIQRILKSLLSPEKYAKYIGVNIGIDNFIPDKDCWSSEPYLITVGNHCQITMGVRLFTHGGGAVLRRNIPDFDAFGKIVIKDFVYIGNNSLIMPGITIGEGSLVAAGSVVTKSVPDNVVVAGNPARIICTIDEYFNKNKIFNVKTRNCSPKTKRKILENTSNQFFIKKQLLLID